MNNFKTKEHINYYFDEKNESLKERFYCSVLHQIFNYYFDIVFVKYSVSENIKDDLRQELHIHIFKNLQKIATAKDSNSFLIVLSKNFTINFLKCQTISFIFPKNGEALELTNCT